MKFYDLNCFYIISDLDTTGNHKKNLLGLIDKMPAAFFDGIQNTDWVLDKDVEREYLEYFKKLLSPELDKIAKRLNHKGWRVQNTWYQQYTNTNEHPWHNHNGANFSGIFYLELPEKELTTQFYDLKNKKIYESFNIKEGQMILYPSHIVHRSPINNTEDRKSVIAFNMDFLEVDLKNDI